MHLEYVVAAGGAKAPHGAKHCCFAAQLQPPIKLVTQLAERLVRACDLHGYGLVNSPIAAVTTTVNAEAASAGTSSPARLAAHTARMLIAPAAVVTDTRVGFVMCCLSLAANAVVACEDEQPAHWKRAAGVTVVAAGGAEFGVADDAAAKDRAGRCIYLPFSDRD